MFMYVLEQSGHNHLDYEDYYHFSKFIGVFSTVEKAKECAEKLIKKIETEYIDEDGYSSFQVIEDWVYSNDIKIWKTIEYGVAYEEMTEYFTVTKTEVDKEE